MLISKSKSTLLKSIAMIVTVIMVLCVCLTACADQEARDAAKEAKDAAQAAKDVAEQAQSSLNDALKDYVKKDEVSKMIEDALNDFAAGDGKTMVTDVLKSEAGSKIISDAFATALGDKLEGLQNEEEVKALIESALAGYNPDVSDAIRDAMQDAMAGYVTEEAAQQLVNNALDGYLDTVKDSLPDYLTAEEVESIVGGALNGYKPTVDEAISDALEAYKTTVSDLVEGKIGDGVATYLASEEAQAVIAGYIAQYQADGLENAIDATAKIVALKNKVDNNHWTTADKNAIDAVYNEKIAPLIEGAEGETDVVKQMYLLLTCDRLTLNANVQAYEDAINACESLEEAAAKIDEKIETLGKNVQGDLSMTLVRPMITTDPAMPGKFGYMILVSEDDGVRYHTVDNLAKLGEYVDNEEIFAAGFDFIVANYGEDMTCFSFVVSDGAGAWTGVEADAVIAPVLADAEKVAEINADIQAMVDKYGADVDSIRALVPAIPDDVRTAEDESVPEHYVYNPACGLLANAELFADYQDMLDTIRTSADQVLKAIDAFNTRAETSGITTDARNWVEYQAAVDAYALYTACRFDNVIDGVEEAYSAFMRGVNDGVAAAEEAARQEQLQAWADAYAEELANLDRLYWANVNDKIPDILHYAAVYDSPIYGVAFTAEESLELMAWAQNYCDNCKETMAYELVPYGTIDSAEKFAAALVDLRNQFAAFNSAIDNVVAAGGPVETALNEIDARYWYSTVKEREFDRVSHILDMHAFTCLDTTANNDLYDIAVLYFNKAALTIKNYKLSTESETPYTDAVEYFTGLYATDDSVWAVLDPMETYFDCRYSVHQGTAPATAPAVETYVPYKYMILGGDVKEQNGVDATTGKPIFVDTHVTGAIEDDYTALIGEFSPASATDDYEYAHYKNQFETTYAAEKNKINSIYAVNDDYAAALAALDAQYAASARELQKDVYEMKIDRTMVTTEQAVNAILLLHYKNGAGAALFVEYYPILGQIVNDYNSNIIPSRTLDNSYAADDVNKEDDATAFANAIAAIAKDFDDVQRKLADTCYGSMLVDKMDELAEAVDTFHATAIAGVEDTYGFFSAIKEQIDAIVGGDAILDDSAITSTTTAYLEEYKALYDAKVADLETAVSDYEALITEAVAATTAVNNAKTAAIDASQALYDAAVEDLGDYDYKVILENNLKALKRNVGDVEMVRPFHMEDDPESTANPVEQIKVYDEITEANLVAARDAALTAIDTLKTNYADSLANYRTEMEAYKAKVEALEGRKASIVQKIESYLAAYDGVGGGRLVDDNADIYWTEYTNVFEKNSAIYNGLQNAIEAVKNVKLVMTKTEEQIAAEAAERGIAVSEVDPYFTADEAFANATARATYVRDENNNWTLKVVDGVAMAGGTIWKALADNIVDEINSEYKSSYGTTNFLWTLNRYL